MKFNVAKRFLGCAVVAHFLVKVIVLPLQHLVNIAVRQSYILQAVLREATLIKDLPLVLVLLALRYHCLDTILKRGTVDNDKAF